MIHMQTETEYLSYKFSTFILNYLDENLEKLRKKCHKMTTELPTWSNSTAKWQQLSNFSLLARHHIEFEPTALSKLEKDISHLENGDCDQMNNILKRSNEMEQKLSNLFNGDISQLYHFTERSRFQSDVLCLVNRRLTQIPYNRTVFF